MRRALLLAAVLTACAGQRPLVRAASQIGLPVELEAPDLEGRVVDVAADRGRVRVVDFWASWCDPCREELPALEALLREQGARGLAVYGVSFDDKLEPVKDFLAKVPVSFAVLWDKGGARYSSRYRVDRLPTTLVVDRQGIIRFVHQTYGPGTSREVRREVDRLLAETP